MIWTVANVIVSVAIGLIVGVKLAVWHRMFNATERFGLGLLGAGCVMTIGPIVASGGPFENWAPILFRVGVAILMIGHMKRYLQIGVRW